jgi:uncharacterized damage-inducible protein DinB
MLALHLLPIPLTIGFVHRGFEMRVADVERLYDYSCWANAKLLAVVSELSQEQFTQTVAGSYGSIRNTLVHVLSAEWGWLDRCGGPPRGERLQPDAFPTVDSLKEVWSRVEADMRAFLANLTADDLLRDVEFALGTGPKRCIPMGALLQHAIIHAAHHRGQVAMLVRVLGFAPGNFDFLLYAIERPSVAA